MKRLIPIGPLLSSGRLLSKLLTARSDPNFVGQWADFERTIIRTDPETFNIELVNQSVYPPTTEVVAENVDSSSGSYTVKAKTFTDVGMGYAKTDNLALALITNSIQEGISDQLPLPEQWHSGSVSAVPSD